MTSFMFDVFLIHYTKNIERLADMRAVFKELCLNYKVIEKWDAGTFEPDLGTPEHWVERVYAIKNILLANADQQPNKNYVASLNRYMATPASTIPWLQPRALKEGEVSVLLKHLSALLNIAYGKKPYGIVFEDDVRLKSDSKKMFDNIIGEFFEKKGNYLDIAGGAGLFANESIEDCLIVLTSPARTRTCACYCISMQLARTIIKDYFPLSLPIDWQIQYSLTKNRVDRCFWAKNPPLLHGSEIGLVKSWRTYNV